MFCYICQQEVEPGHDREACLREHWHDHGPYAKNETLILVMREWPELFDEILGLDGVASVYEEEIQRALTGGAEAVGRLVQELRDTFAEAAYVGF